MTSNNSQPYYSTPIKWLRTNRKHPCMVCNRPGWCEVSDDSRVAHCMRTPSDQPMRWRGGGWIHRLGIIGLDPGPLATTSRRPTRDEKPEQAPLPPPPATTPPAIQPLSPLQVDEINRAFLAICPLSPHHEAYLQKAGVPFAGCGSLVYSRASSIARQLVARFGEATARRHPILIEIESRNKRHWWTIAGAADGLLFPAINEKDQVLGIQIRKDQPRGSDDRYRWLSHASLGGTPLTFFRATPDDVTATSSSSTPKSRATNAAATTTATATTTLPAQATTAAASSATTTDPGFLTVLPHHHQHHQHLIITEGYKKAGVAARHWGCHALSLAGVGAYRENDLVELVTSLGVKGITLAFDQDKHYNRAVLQAQERLLRLLAATFPHTDIYILNWDGDEEGGGGEGGGGGGSDKGVDDALAYGAKFHFDPALPTPGVSRLVNDLPGEVLKRVFGRSEPLFTLAEARQRHREFLMKNSPGPASNSSAAFYAYTQSVITSPTGSGKSSAADNALADSVSKGRLVGRWLLLAPNKANIVERTGPNTALGQAVASGLVAIQRGRHLFDLTELDSRVVEPEDCANPLVGEAGAARQITAQVICKDCIFGSDKNWQKYLEEQGQGQGQGFNATPTQFLNVTTPPIPANNAATIPSTTTTTTINGTAADGTAADGTAATATPPTIANTVTPTTGRPFKCEVEGYLHTQQVSRRTSVVIATKQAFLNESKLIEDFDGIICDEEIVPHLIEIINVTSGILAGWREKIALKHLDYPQWGRLFAIIERAFNGLAEVGKRLDRADSTHPVAGAGRLTECRPVLEMAATSLGYDLHTILAECEGTVQQSTAPTATTTTRATITGEEQIYDFERHYRHNNQLVLPFRAGRELLTALSDPANPAHFARNTVDGSYYLVLHIPRRKLIERLQEKTLVILDATVSPALRFLLPDLKELHYRVPQNLEITQVTSGLYTKQDLYNAATRDRLSQAISAFLDEPNDKSSTSTSTSITGSGRQELGRRPQEGQPAPPHQPPPTPTPSSSSSSSSSYSYQRHLTILPLRFQTGPQALTTPHGSQTEHWGLHRATSRYSECDSLTLVGHYIRPIDYIRAEIIAARAFALYEAGSDYDDEEIIQSHAAATNPNPNPPRWGARSVPIGRLRVYNHQLGNGRVAGRWMKADPDKDVQAAIEHEYEANIIQAVGRLRAALRPAHLPPARVLILCNEPVGNLTINHLTTVDELLRRPRTNPSVEGDSNNNNHVKGAEKAGSVKLYRAVEQGRDPWSEDLIQDETSESQIFEGQDWRELFSIELRE